MNATRPPSRRGAADPTPRGRRVVILAGKKSHGLEGNGIHDYPAIARLLQDGLQQSLRGAQLTVVRAENDSWPAAAIADADAIVIVGDGRDGDLPYAEAAHLADDARKTQIAAAVARGAGLVPIHFSIFTPERDLPTVLAWQGAAFHWEQQGRRDWVSKISWAAAPFELCAAEHPLLRGVKPLPLREEYYHRLAFHPAAQPLIAIRALPGDTAADRVVAWSIERPDGGRSAGTSMGHSLDSFRHDGLRTLTLNMIAWAAGLPVPDDGIQAPFAERETVDARLGIGPQPAPIRVAVLSGNNAHRWHNWPESTAALMRAWSDDARITVRVHTDPADLATALADRDVLVLNWVNWHDPAGMPAAAQQAIRNFVEAGGGVFVHHFANGACHPSLPEAGPSDWPWYRRTLVRRVWEHRPVAPGPSSHDKYGTFEVRPRGSHPLVAGLTAFAVEDELYWRQHGTEPIDPLLTAQSNVTGCDEPLLWAYTVGAGRVVQSLLGHSAKTYDSPHMQTLARRIVAWAAKRSIHGPAV